MPSPARSVMDMSDVEVKYKIMQLERELEAVKDLHDVVLETKYTTAEIQQWKQTSDNLIKQVSENFLQVSMTLQQVSVTQEYTTKEITRLGSDVEGLKNTSKISIKDIIQHVIFMMIGAFFTILIAIMSGGK